MHVWTSLESSCGRGAIGASGVAVSCYEVRAPHAWAMLNAALIAASCCKVARIESVEGTFASFPAVRAFFLCGPRSGIRKSLTLFLSS